MLVTLPSCTVNKVKGSVALKTSAGNAVLDIMPQKLLEEVNVGDVVIITIGDFCDTYGIDIGEKVLIEKNN